MKPRKRENKKGYRRLSQRHTLGILCLVILGLTGCSGGSGAQKTEPEQKEPVQQEMQQEGSSKGSAAEEADLEEAGSEALQTEAITETIQEAQPITFTMHFVDPENSPYVEGGEKIAQLVEEATDGRITIEVLSGGVLGGERDTLALAMDNQLDIATCANSVLTNYIPQMNILDQAYLWKNAQEAHAAVDGPVGDLIRERALTLGLHVIGFEESGFRNTFSTKPIQTMEDFAGVTIRTMENKYHQAAFEAFGASPVAMAYTEVFDALKNGTVDACENATANCLNSGYYEITKNVTNTQHAFVYIILCMSEEAWSRIPDDLQEPFLAAVQEGVAWERERLVEANNQATDELKTLGVTFYDIDVAALQEAYQARAKELGFVFDPDWQAAVDEVLSSMEAQTENETEAS